MYEFENILNKKFSPKSSLNNNFNMITNIQILFVYFFVACFTNSISFPQRNLVSYMILFIQMLN